MGNSAEGAQEDRRAVGASARSQTPCLLRPASRGLSRKPFWENRGEDHRGCRADTALRGRCTRAFWGREPAGPRPALPSAEACSYPPLCAPQACTRALAVPSGAWGLAQTPQEPSMEARRLLGPHGKDLRPGLCQPEVCFCLQLSLPTPRPKN